MKRRRSNIKWDGGEETIKERMRMTENIASFTGVVESVVYGMFKSQENDTETKAERGERRKRCRSNIEYMKENGEEGDV
jgi:hypothetical protein